MIKRSECTCACHSAGVPIIHFNACCIPDSVFTVSGTVEVYYEDDNFLEDMYQGLESQMNFKFKRYDGKTLDWVSTNFYSELADELGVERGLAKELFWKVVMRASNLRLGAAAQSVAMSDIKAEDENAYSLTGEFAREIIEHYIIEKFRMLNIVEAT